MHRSLALTLLLLLGATALIAALFYKRPSVAESGGRRVHPFTESTRTEVIEGLAQRLQDHYIFAEVGARMAATLRAQNAKGAYGLVGSGEVFRDRLNRDLYEASRDRHLRLWYPDIHTGPTMTGPPEKDPQFRREMAAQNYGFHEIRQLEGNIGYIDLRMLLPIDMAEETAKNAMARIADTNALILDLRENGGGTPEMIDFICTYLFPPGQRIHLNDFERREEPMHVEFFTLPSVPGKNYAGRAVYVLTSSETFSGGEEFAYDLQALKRATIVGEVTGGGANPVQEFLLPGDFSVFIPTGRAVNPITKTNWEGTGVTPDVLTSAATALDVAHLLALKNVARLSSLSPSQRAQTDRVIQDLEQRGTKQ